MASLKPFGPNGLTRGDPGTLAGAPADPNWFPGPEARSLLKRRRLLRAVEFVVTHPNPTVQGMADTLEVSRTTAWRVLRDPEFERLLRGEVHGQLRLWAHKALQAIGEALDKGSPAVKLRAACWLVDRFTRVSSALGEDPDPEVRSAMVKAQLDEIVQRHHARRKAREQAEANRGQEAPASGGTPGPQGGHMLPCAGHDVGTVAASATQPDLPLTPQQIVKFELAEQRSADEELVDAELLSPDPTRGTWGIVPKSK